MKKQNNSVSNWSIKGIVSIAILSTMLCTFNANANSKPSVGNSGTVKVVSENGFESLMFSNAGTKNEYNSKEFVQVDIADEIENWMNTNSRSDNESIDEYNAKKFVQADLSNEIESWLKISSF